MAVAKSKALVAMQRGIIGKQAQAWYAGNSSASNTSSIINARVNAGSDKLT